MAAVAYKWSLEAQRYWPRPPGGIALYSYLVCPFLASKSLESFSGMGFVCMPWYLLQRPEEVPRDTLRILPNAKKNVGFAGPQPVQAQEIQPLDFRQALPVRDISQGIQNGQFEVRKIGPETVCPNDGADVPARQVEGYG